MLTPEARARLDEDGEYGVVWYPEKQVTRLDPDPERGYQRPRTFRLYDRDEQVPIPIVSSGIPRELVDAARRALKDNVRSYSTGERVYQLAGLIYCAECGNRLSTCRKRNPEKTYSYYRCQNHQRNGSRLCSMSKSYPADALEGAVLRAVLHAVKDKDELVRQAEERFERERARVLRAGGADSATWHRRLEELDRERANYQRAFASEAISLDDLRARTSELDAERGHLNDLLAEYEGRAAKLRALEAARDTAIGQIRRGEWAELGITAPEARRERYREIGLTASADAEGTVELRWGLGAEATVSTSGHTSRGTGRRSTARS